MIIKKNELFALISEEVKRQQKKKMLEERLAQIQGELKDLESSPIMISEEDLTNSGAMGLSTTQDEMNQDTPQEESIFSCNFGEILMLHFNGNITIKLQRQLGDFFKVIEADDSQQLKRDDFLQVKGQNSKLSVNKSLTFPIIRDTGLTYQSRELKSWEIIKNK